MIAMSMRSYPAYALGERELSRAPRDPLSRDALPFFTQGESRTRQSEKDSADVNAIVERFSRTGQLPPARFEGSYGDVTSLQGDLTDLYNRSQEVQAQYRADMERQAAPAAPAPAPAPSDPPAASPAPAAE